MQNMELWERWQSVPREAQKPIKGGRLSGMTDINPMWRMRALTETFGPCGVGWYYAIDKMWTEAVGDEVLCFVQISLLYRVDDAWSMPIIGVGGNKIAMKEKNGIYASDEGYKMALTDAISVACKALGVGADVYWQGGESKYDAVARPDASAAKTAPPAAKRPTRAERFNRLCEKHGMTQTEMSGIVSLLTEQGTIVNKYSKDMTDAEYDATLLALDKEVAQNGGGIEREAG